MKYTIAYCLGTNCRTNVELIMTFDYVTMVCYNMAEVEIRP